MKPFFDEVAQDVVNHVRVPQFKQCLTVGLGFRDLSEQQQELLTEKYLDDEYGDLVGLATFWPTPVISLHFILFFLGLAIIMLVVSQPPSWMLASC